MAMSKGPWPPHYKIYEKNLYYLKFTNNDFAQKRLGQPKRMTNTSDKVTGRRWGKERAAEYHKQ